jgi:hypothetical protein
MRSLAILDAVGPAATVAFASLDDGDAQRMLCVLSLARIG